MGVLKKVWNFLFDHKTYVISGVAAILSGMLAAGKISQDQYNISMAMLTPAGLASLRHAIAKMGTDVSSMEGGK